MTKTDISGNYLNDVWIALGLLTRLPHPTPVWPDTERPARAAWAYPFAGLVVALLAGVIVWPLLAWGVPASYGAGIALLVMTLSTGAMHEDGLADCADGFWGGWDRDRRLKIMKDSSSGAYGVAALILSFGLRWTALAALFTQGWVFAPLLVAAVTSRTGMVWSMAMLPNARADGLSSTTGRPPLSVAGIATLWALAACGLGFGFAGITLMIATVCAAALWAFVAMRKVEGQTGDVLGATQQVCEGVVLGAMAGLV